MDEFKAVNFEKDELEYGDISLLVALLQLLANQDPKSHAKHKYQDI